MSSNRPLILCVDDDHDGLTIIRLSLELDNGLIVRTADNGVEALRLMNEGLAPDLVLIDAHMPQLSGPELAIAIQMLAVSPPPAIVFLTAAVWPDQVVQYHATGAAGVIAKPFNPLTLASQVRQHLVI